MLPAGARPHGFSLADIAPLVDRFTSSGNDPACYPETPFQLLYASSAELRPVGGGVVVTGTNSFRTSPGICLCAALFSVDDTPPCPGSFPTTLSDVPAYLFDEAHYGGRDFEVVVDGTSTRIGAEYLVGPCRREADGSHFIHMAAFIGPLSPGRHTVTARGGVFGRGVAEAYGASFVQEEFTYTVDVLEPQ